MKNLPLIITFVLTCIIILSDPFISQAYSAPQKTVKSTNSSSKQKRLNKKNIQRPIKRLLKAIRYEKDNIALKSFDGSAQGAALLDDTWDAKSPKEQQQFVQLLHSFFTLIAFPKLRKDLKHLETIIYQEPVREGELVKQKATIVVLHTLKKQEVHVDFFLKPFKREWLISDFTIGGGDTFLTKLKRDQIQPLLKDKGWDGLIKAMETRVNQLKKK